MCALFILKELNKYYNLISVASLFKDKNLTFEEFEQPSFQDWIEIVTSDLKGNDYTEKFNWQTLEGISYLPFYENKNDFSTQETINIGSDWGICQSISASTVQEANKLALIALEGGASELLFDLSADVLSKYEDVEILLDKIILNYITVYFGEIISEQKHQDWVHKYIETHYKVDKVVQVFFKNDEFSKAIQSGFLREKKDFSYQPFYSVNAHFYGNTGASMVDQLAFAAASGNEYLGLAENVEEMAQKLYFNFSIASDYFLEIAKLRAFRLIWTQILEQYSTGLGAKYPANIQAHTAAFNTSHIDAHNNILRATTEAMSAAIGGANSIAIIPFDAVYEDGNTFSDRISRNIHHLLKEEAYFDKVADPGAGSYFIENLTLQLAENAWKIFQEIEKQGGMYTAVSKGFVQSRILENQQMRLEAANDGETKILGVNFHPPKEIGKNSVKKKIPIFEKPENAIQVKAVHTFRIAESFEKEATL